MKKKVPCDVCGKENDYFSWGEEDPFGIVEKYYYCDNCGFFVETVHSPELRGMCIGYEDEEEELDKLEKREKYKDRIKELGLECYNF